MRLVICEIRQLSKKKRGGGGGESIITSNTISSELGGVVRGKN